MGLSMKITNLQVNRLFAPVGISALNPVFSFKVEGEGCGNIKSVKIDVATDELFKNIVFSKRLGNISPNAFRLPYDFSGGIKYFWRVMLTNENKRVARLLEPYINIVTEKFGSYISSKGVMRTPETLLTHKFIYNETDETE